MNIGCYDNVSSRVNQLDFGWVRKTHFKRQITTCSIYVEQTISQYDNNSMQVSIVHPEQCEEYIFTLWMSIFWVTFDNITFTNKATNNSAHKSGAVTWRWSVVLAIIRSWVRFSPRARLHSNLGQVVHTYVPLLPSSITWYRSKDGNVLWPGRWLQA